ncbi:MAG TPA: glutamate--tRNA ligase [Gemmatimonadaceae bacterium]|nr:glutamate--tRNA ligase [Gemmatimonadaceae bacterium]
MSTPLPPRLRFAPSPTGSLHVGVARTALHNWLYARKYGGAFLLRVEDTDRARSTPESTQGIFDGLRWLGLNWDEAVVHQGANLAQHQQDARMLLASGAAYRDFTPAEELDRLRKEAESRGHAFRVDRAAVELSAEEQEQRLARGEAYAIRFRVPEGTTAWDDMVHGPIEFPNKDIEDFIILRSDGTPVYNMAVVSDDIAMRITLVMRGDDHISNTPKQILLYQALGAPLPRFAHLPMILGVDGKKLSKRHGATSVAEYEHQGILADAMVNFLALLGWSPGGDIEVMSREELVARFEESGFLKKAAVFDPKKLEWMNGQHLAHAPIERLEPVITPHIVAAGLATEQEITERLPWYRRLLELLRVRARTIDDIVRQAAPYFRDQVEYDSAAVAKHWKNGGRELVGAARERLAASDWDAAALEDALRDLAESRGIGAGALFQPLRVALTGSSASPGIFDVLVLLGRDRALRRLDSALANLA